MGKMLAASYSGGKDGIFALYALSLWGAASLTRRFSGIR